MTTYNFSTNAFPVNTFWPDNTSQVVLVPPGGSIKSPGIIDAASNQWCDTLTDQYIAVNDDLTGFQVHDIGSVQNLFLTGFGVGAVLCLLSMAAWAAVRGLKANIME